MQARSASNILAIDVSHHQGTIDWPKVKSAGVRGAFIKATEGVGYNDPQFRRNAMGAAAVGIMVGFYHYAHPEMNGPIAEANAFLDAVKGIPVHMPYVLDVEGDAAKVGGTPLTAWCMAWLQEVKKRTGRTVMIYTGASFAKSYLGKELAQFPLWVAHYGVNQPMANGKWDRWAVFQYADHGKVDGIAGNGLDMDVIEADVFKQWTAPAQPATKPAIIDPAKGQAFVDFLGEEWGRKATQADKDRIHAVADAVRDIAGIPKK